MKILKVISAWKKKKDMNFRESHKVLEAYHPVQFSVHIFGFLSEFGVNWSQ